MKVRTTEASAIFKHANYKTQKAHARILWEVNVDTNPPATIRPAKPKLWLLKRIELNTNKVNVLH